MKFFFFKYKTFILNSTFHENPVKTDPCPIPSKRGFLDHSLIGKAWLHQGLTGSELCFTWNYNYEFLFSFQENARL